MALRIHKNNFATTLNGAINNSTTTVIVTSATGLPTSLSGGQTFNLTLEDGTNVEILQVTAISTNTLTVVRGAESTSARSWPDLSIITLNATADSLDRKADLNSPILITPNIGIPSAGTLTNCTGLPIAGISTGDSSSNLKGNNFINGYTTTVTAAGTTTLTIASTQSQYFTGSTTQTVVLPVVSTLSLGQTFNIVNLSTGSITVNSSGANLVTTVVTNSSSNIVCVAITGTTAASWSVLPGSAAGVSSLAGTTNQIAVSGSTGVVTISIPNNAVLPGTGGVVVPQGSSGSEPGASTTGKVRFNTSTGYLRVDDSSSWNTVVTNNAGTATSAGIPIWAGTNNFHLVDSGVTIANGNINSVNPIKGYTTTVTAAATTTLTVSSTGQQYFTGSTTQTLKLPVTSTLVLGQSYRVVNNSTGVVTAQSSGANTIQAMAANTVAVFTCILTSGTSATSWDYEYIANASDISGSGLSIRQTSPTLITPILGTPTSGNISNCTSTSMVMVTPVLGVASATSVNFGQDALNYYDEGTFTPVFSFSTPGDLAVVYTKQLGKYTRIGNKVTIECGISWTPTYLTAANSATITGLPFTPVGGGNYEAISGNVDKSAFTLNAGATNLGMMTVDNLLYFVGGGTGIASGTLTTSNFPTAVAQYIFFSLTYLV